MAMAQRMLKACSGPQLRKLQISLEWDVGNGDGRFLSLASIRTNFTGLRSLALHGQVHGVARVQHFCLRKFTHFSAQDARKDVRGLRPAVRSRLSPPLRTR